MKKVLYTAICVIACVLVTIGMISRKNAGTRSTTKDDEDLESLLTSAFFSNGTGSNEAVIEDLKSIFSSVSTVSDIKQENSPQNKAFQWIIEDIQQSNSRWTDDDYQEQIKERYILAVLYYSTNGPEWKKQNSFLDHSKDICSWWTVNESDSYFNQGITCDKYDGSIKLRLVMNDLEGHLPSEIGMFSRLGSLELHGNKMLSGTIPSELGHLSQLTLLSLQSNDFEGKVSTELGKLSRLNSIFLSFNRLNGTIPTELGQLFNLRSSLYLNNNILEGGIPTELGLLSQLESLKLSSNKLNGTIPSELGQLSDLRELQLDENNLKGPIPTELGLLSQLESISLSGNRLNGTIPSNIGQLSEIESLFLFDNNLEGQIPMELGMLSRLTDLFLSSNKLNGTIPTSFSQLTNLQYLGLHDNSLQGDAEFLCSMPNLSLVVDVDEVHASCAKKGQKF